MLNEGGVELDQLRVSRAEFLGSEGIHRLAKQLDGVEEFSHLAQASRTFFHRVYAGLAREEGINQDIHALAKKSTGAEEGGEDTTAPVKDRVLKYLRKNHGYFFHILGNYRPIVQDEQAEIPPALSRLSEIEDAILESVVSFVAGKKGLPVVREELEYGSVRKILPITQLIGKNCRHTG